MTTFSKVFKPLLAAVLAFGVPPAAPVMAQDAPTKVRIGYWPSGLTLGYGSVLEAGSFFKDQGLEVEYVHFSDVNGPTRAIAANAIDLAFGAPAAGAFSLASDGVPVKIILATQPANVEFVVPADSGINGLQDFKGKKVAMSPAGSSTAAIAGAILKLNYGLDAADYSLVPGNESRLVQFLSQKEVDAAALRNVTIAQLTDLKVKKLGSFPDEWRKLTKSDGVPYNAVGIVRNDWLEKHPEAAVKAVVALRRALDFGQQNPEAVVKTVSKAANLSEAESKVFADLWDQNYRVSLTDADQDTLKRMFAIFKESGVLKGELPDNVFDARPYQEALKVK